MEKTETIRIRRGGHPQVSWCVPCGQRTEMLRIDEAAAVRAVTPKWLEQQIANGRLHCSEAEAGTLLVCFSSLMLLEVPVAPDAESSSRAAGKPRRPK